MYGIRQDDEAYYFSVIEFKERRANKFICNQYRTTSYVTKLPEIAFSAIRLLKYFLYMLELYYCKVDGGQKPLEVQVIKH